MYWKNQYINYSFKMSQCDLESIEIPDSTRSEGSFVTTTIVPATVHQTFCMPCGCLRNLYASNNFECVDCKDRVLVTPARTLVKDVLFFFLTEKIYISDQPMVKWSGSATTFDEFVDEAARKLLDSFSTIDYAVYKIVTTSNNDGGIIVTNQNDEDCLYTAERSVVELLSRTFPLLSCMHCDWHDTLYDRFLNKTVKLAELWAENGGKFLNQS